MTREMSWALWLGASGVFALTAAIYLWSAQASIAPAYGLAPVVPTLDVWAEVACGGLAAFCAVVSFLIAVFRMRVPAFDH